MDSFCACFFIDLHLSVGDVLPVYDLLRHLGVSDWLPVPGVPSVGALRSRQFPAGWFHAEQHRHRFLCHVVPRLSLLLHRPQHRRSHLSLRQVSQSIRWSINQSFGQLIRWSINQSFGQSIRWSINQSFGQSIRWSINHLVNWSSSQLINHLAINQSFMLSINKSIIQAASQSISQALIVSII